MTSDRGGVRWGRDGRRAASRSGKGAESEHGDELPSPRSLELAGRVDGKAVRAGEGLVQTRFRASVLSVLALCAIALLLRGYNADLSSEMHFDGSAPRRATPDSKPCEDVYKRLGCDLSEFSGRPAKMLGLNPFRLTVQSVKKRYVKLARLYHPDRYLSKRKRNKAHHVFLHLVNARDVLIAKLEKEQRLPSFDKIPFHWM